MKKYIDGIFIGVGLLFILSLLISPFLALWEVHRTQRRIQQHEDILMSLLKAESPYVTRDDGAPVPLFGYILNEINKLKGVTPTPAPAFSPLLVP